MNFLRVKLYIIYSINFDPGVRTYKYTTTRYEQIQPPTQSMHCPHRIAMFHIDPSRNGFQLGVELTLQSDSRSGSS